MFLLLLSQTHYFSLFVFLSCGSPFIRLSCGLQKKTKKQHNSKHRKKCYARPHYNAALASERGRWRLRKEGGTERRKHCVFLDIFVSKDNSSLGCILLVHCHRKWWILHMSRPCESMSRVAETPGRKVSSEPELPQGGMHPLSSGSLLNR